MRKNHRAGAGGVELGHRGLEPLDGVVLTCVVPTVVQVADVGEMLGEKRFVVPLDAAVDDARDPEAVDIGQLVFRSSGVDVPADVELRRDDVQVGVLGDGVRQPRASPPKVLTPAEQQTVLSVLRAPEHCDLAVAQVWARELDEGRYYCSVCSMYRISRATGEVGPDCGLYYDLYVIV